ncbi:hypothetical protein GCM10027259_52370 [Micromonospora palomenae]
MSEGDAESGTPNGETARRLLGMAAGSRTGYAGRAPESWTEPTHDNDRCRTSYRPSDRGSPTGDDQKVTGVLGLMPEPERRGKQLGVHHREVGT